MAPRSDLEDRRIAWLAKLFVTPPRPPGSLGIGDDAALLRAPPGEDLAISVDCQVEGTHFERPWLAPEDIGYRAVAAAVSDLAAMGAKPLAMFAAWTLTPHDSEAFFRGVARGVHQGALEYRMPLLGGNLSRGPFALAITVVGSCPRNRALRRSGARPGDSLYVTGSPGLARAGYELLASGRHKTAGTALANPALAAFRRPTARVNECRSLRRRFKVAAAIDLSDGLLKDLERLLAAAEEPCGAELDAGALQTIEPTASAARTLGKEPLELVLLGGEDYELLLAVREPKRSGSRARPEAAEPRSFRVGGTPLTRIGRVVGRRGIRIADSQGPVKLRAAAFEHFPSASRVRRRPR